MTGAPLHQAGFLRRPALIGTLLLSWIALPGHAMPAEAVAAAEAATASVLCYAQPAVRTARLEPSGAQPEDLGTVASENALTAAAAVLPTVADVSQQSFADSLRPVNPLMGDEGLAAATLAGAALMLLGGWRWYRASRLPWPPEPELLSGPHPPSLAADIDTVPMTEGWRLSGFDDLPGSTDLERTLRPLYESLDEADIIDIEPLPPRH